MALFKKKQPHEKPIDSAMVDFLYIYIGADTKTVLNSEDFYTYMDILDKDINIPYNKYLDNAFKNGCMSVYTLLRRWFTRKCYGLKDTIRILERLGGFDNSFNEYFLSNVIDRKSILLYNDDDFKLLFSSEILYKNNNLSVFLIKSLDLIDLDLLERILYANPKGTLISEKLTNILVDSYRYQYNEELDSGYVKYLTDNGFHADKQNSLYIILINYFMENSFALEDLYKLLTTKVKIKKFEGPGNE